MPAKEVEVSFMDTSDQYTWIGALVTGVVEAAHDFGFELWPVVDFKWKLKTLKTI